MLLSDKLSNALADVDTLRTKCLDSPAATFVHEPEAIAARHELGIENVLWSTDFPHPCCNWPNAAAKVEQLFQGVPAEEVHKITWQNGATMYGIA